MTHLASTQLHEVAYGLAERPSHLDLCDECRRGLERIEDEQEALRLILKDPSWRSGRSRRVRPSRPSFLSLAAAAILLSGLSFMLFYSAVAELTLDEVIDRMERAAADARGARFTVQAKRGFFENDAHVEAARDGTIRIRLPDMNTYNLNEREMVLAPDAVYHVEEQQGRMSELRRLRRIAEKIPPASAERFVPFAERVPCDDSWIRHPSALLFFALSPRRAFAYERGLELMGKREIGGEEYYLLASRRALETGPATEEHVQAASELCIFRVGARDFRLRSMEKRRSNERGISRTAWTIEEYRDGLPRRIRADHGWQPPGAYGLGSNHSSALFETVSPVRVPALDGASLLPPSTELYASFARMPDLKALLKRAPEDPDLNVSLAVAGARATRPRENTVDTNPPEMSDWVEALERAAARTESQTLARNLLGLYARRNQREKLVALAERLAKDPARTPLMTLDAAEAFNTAGAPERALALLEGLEDGPRTRVAEERIYAHLLRGDAGRAVAEFAPLATPRWMDRLEALYERLPSDARQTIDAAAVMRALDAAVRQSPRSIELHRARCHLAAKAGPPDRKIQVAEEAFHATGDESMVGTAISAMVEQIKPRGTEASPDEKAALRKLLAIRIPLPDAITKHDWNDVTRGIAFMLAGDLPAARAWYRSYLDRFVPETNDEAYEMGLLLPTPVLELGEDGLFERACRVFFDSLRREDRRDSTMGFGFSVSGISFVNPEKAYAKRCAEKGRWTDLYHALKGIYLGMSSNPIIFGLELSEEDLAAFLRAARAEALKDPKDVAGLKWLAESTDGRQEVFDAKELWEKAREWAPYDLEVLVNVIRGCMGRLDRVRLVKACEDYVSTFDRHPAGPAPCSRAHVLLALAQAHLKWRDPEAAKAALARIGVERAALEPRDAWQAGILLERVGQADLAIKLFRDLADQGYGPYLRLARLYLERQNWMEAITFLNRARLYGHDKEIPVPRRRGGLGSFFERDPFTAREDLDALRRELFEKAGADYFLDKFLASRLPVPTADEERRAAELYESLSSDNPDLRDRAVEGLRALGPKAAAVLRHGLKSSDAEVRLQVRTLFSEWAEPR